MTPQQKTTDGRSIIDRIFQPGTEWQSSGITRKLIGVTEHEVTVSYPMAMDRLEQKTYFGTLLEIGHSLNIGGQLIIERDDDWFIDVSALHLLCKCEPVGSKIFGSKLIIAKEDSL